MAFDAELLQMGLSADGLADGRWKAASTGPEPEAVLADRLASTWSWTTAEGASSTLPQCTDKNSTGH